MFISVVDSVFRWRILILDHPYQKTAIRENMLEGLEKSIVHCPYTFTHLIASGNCALVTRKVEMPLS